ncbi:MAG: DUF3445 domain-containing protein [Trueperaceae bacterium]|nr:DUF3445 domain-containing protein [Trueperaceae bacterium]
MRRTEDPPFPRDQGAAHRTRAKLGRLRRVPGQVRARDPKVPDATLAADLHATAAAVAETRPDRVQRVDAPRDAHAPVGVTVAGWRFSALGADAARLLADAPAATRLGDALALSLPEDLVWMRCDGAAGRAALLHVSFPSHWAPETRAGASLLELHGPVADGARLRDASAAVMKAICSKGRYQRFVWNLVQGGAASRHPDEVGRPGPAKAPEEGDVLSRWWFRVERQGTLPFPARGFALFTIRILQAPLRAVLAAEPGRAARLAASIRSMRPEVLAYKGLAQDRDALLAALDAADAGAGRQGAPSPPSSSPFSASDPSLPDASGPSAAPSSNSNEASTLPSTTTSFVSRS